MKRTVIFGFFLVCSRLSATILFSFDYDEIGFGDSDEEIFSTDIPLDSISKFNSIQIELSYSYVGELTFTIISPSGQEFQLLNMDGARTRVGAGDGLLGGTEVYTLRNPSEVTSNVQNWGLTRYQPGGEYGAGEWPTGSWASGTWNITLLNDDVSFIGNGVVGNVTITGTLVPEPSSVILGVIGSSVCLLRRNRQV